MRADPNTAPAPSTTNEFVETTIVACKYQQSQQQCYDTIAMDSLTTTASSSWSSSPMLIPQLPLSSPSSWPPNLHLQLFHLEIDKFNTCTSVQFSSPPHSLSRSLRFRCTQTAMLQNPSPHSRCKFFDNRATISAANLKLSETLAKFLLTIPVTNSTVSECRGRVGNGISR